MKYQRPFDFFSQRTSLSMDQIEWWLLKYAHLYDEAKNAIDPCSGCSRLRFHPDCPLHSEYSRCISDFIGSYEQLNELSQLHHLEDYLKQQIKLYHRIKTYPNLLTKWLLKNRTIGSEQLLCFELDYCSEEYPNFLYVYFIQKSDLEIFIPKSYFKNTLRFLKIFDGHFWRNEQLTLVVA